MDEKKISRREFITETGVKVAGTGILLSQLSTHPAFGATTAPQEKKKSEHTMAYRTLGKTGLKVSEVSFGVMRLKEPGSQQSRRQYLSQLMTMIQTYT